MRAPNIYPEERKVLRQLGDISQFVVGGFHKADCVSRFAHAGREICRDTEIDGFSQKISSIIC